jgi:type I restriction enzyme S subunit
MSNWETLPLGDVLTFQRGFDITKAEQRDGPYWVISSSGPKSKNEHYKVGPTEKDRSIAAQLVSAAESR